MSADARSVVRFRPGRSPGWTDTPRTVDEALERHLDTLYAVARLLTGNAAAAEDLVQETALNAFRHWGELRAPEAAKSWLLRILNRCCSNARRRDSRRAPIADVDLDELVASSIAADPPPADAPLSDDVEAALAALPAGFREAVWLVDVEDLTLGETAAALDLPAGTVASRVYRARQKLREHLRSRRKS